MIEESALPMPLLTHHCVQISMLFAQFPTRSTQTRTIEFQFTNAQHQTEHVNALLDLANRHRETQAKKV